MKKVLFFLTIITLPVLGFAQEKSIKDNVSKELNLIKETNTQTVKKKTAKKAKYIRVNYKKSTDIISIKAYRKSLQIKTRTKKLC